MNHSTAGRPCSNRAARSAAEASGRRRPGRAPNPTRFTEERSARRRRANSSRQMTTPTLRRRSGSRPQTINLSRNDVPRGAREMAQIEHGGRLDLSGTGRRSKSSRNDALPWQVVPRQLGGSKCAGPTARLEAPLDDVGWLGFPTGRGLDVPCQSAYRRRRNRDNRVDPADAKGTSRTISSPRKTHVSPHSPPVPSDGVQPSTC